MTNNRKFILRSMSEGATLWRSRRRRKTSWWLVHAGKIDEVSNPTVRAMERAGSIRIESDPANEHDLHAKLVS